MKILEYKVVKHDLTSLVGAIYSENGVSHYGEKNEIRKYEYENIKFDGRGCIRPRDTHKKFGRYHTLTIDQFEQIKNKVGEPIETIHDAVNKLE